ncbi:hypothetical protein COS16_07970 [Candidatus Desantisbacteria bacterium CG02_land_8_20_14_3_00_49_13]|nr:MAG: hypothetical protein AUJ67_03835 [Candidatus Desantisbacteria bacterium CG1_02_49_89]PIV55199.1 MAG: hypothetical protein COS16_07970 [Candidatus Desantisbacteria bacterium CG02_land_8_20_14_3_00_49_13]
MLKRIKNPFWFLAVAAACAVLHNVIYGIWKVEESVFFTMTFVFGIWFVVSAVIRLFSRKRS